MARNLEADTENDGETDKQGGDKSGTSIPTTDGETGSVEGLISNLEICGDMLRMFLKIPLAHEVSVDRDNICNHNWIAMRLLNERGLVRNSIMTSSN